MFCFFSSIFPGRGSANPICPYVRTPMGCSLHFLRPWARSIGATMDPTGMRPLRLWRSRGPSVYLYLPCICNALDNLHALIRPHRMHRVQRRCCRCSVVCVSVCVCVCWTVWTDEPTEMLFAGVISHLGRWAQGTPGRQFAMRSFVKFFWPLVFLFLGIFSVVSTPVNISCCIHRVTVT